jgi:hypothetical protein
MLPARTVSPPNTFTPRLCPWLSRPLRELPPAFLWAIEFSFGLRFDCGDLQSCLILAVTLLAAITLSSFLLEDQYLLCSSLTDNLARNLRIGYQRRANLDLAVATDEQHIGQRHRVAHRTRELLDFDKVPFGHAVLLPAGSDDGILHNYFPEVNFLKQKPAKVNKASTFGNLSHELELSCPSAAELATASYLTKQT